MYVSDGAGGRVQDCGRGGAGEVRVWDRGGGKVGGDPGGDYSGVSDAGVGGAVGKEVVRADGGAKVVVGG